MNKDYIILHKQDPTLPKIKLFLLFMKGDQRISDAFDWSLAVSDKINAMKVLFEEVLEQLPQCFDELKEIKERGYGNDVECLKLARKYEIFLNSIYSLCENISRIVAYLYPDKNLPQNFFKQKNRFLEQEIDSIYGEILVNTDWDDEVRSIRSEATHYLSGFITISSSTELGYFNKPKSERKGTPKNISINDVEKHINQVYDNVCAFLSAFGDHFLKIVNQDSRIALPCIRTSSGLIGTKSISLREYLNNEAGICLTSDFDCPLKDSCNAHRKSKK
uniref:Uncharacterized protein n=1 Tax=Candidatus Methanophaga sp. ANME-1 ERB7 TaxID=2759913 RepID=A0A7G9Z204_9EURY|nr:hypothetical protein FGBIHFOD_00028 [Methanosarcinales archaeon ANME-1 ERB7]